jgi:hypothetical protein
MKKLVCKTLEGKYKVIHVENDKITCYKASMLIDMDYLKEQSTETPQKLEDVIANAPFDKLSIRAGEKIGELHIVEEIEDRYHMPRGVKRGFLRGENRTNLIRDIQSGKADLADLAVIHNVEISYVRKLAGTLEPA